MDVGILGATGVVGQQFIRLLDGHPWFRVTWLAASERSEGRTYAEAASWRLATPMPAWAASMPVQQAAANGAPRLLFSSLDAAVAGDIEGAFAAAGHVVVSNARNYRMEADVPLLVPEINADHLALIERQREARGWAGAIVTNPNCSTVFLAMALAPLRPFGIERVIVSTMQAVSGAGYPGVASLDIVGNVVPYIGGEEEKIERETLKILGRAGAAGVEPLAAAVSAQTTRVPVLDGHTESVSVGLREQVDVAAIREALASWRGEPQERGLPSAPPAPIVVLDAPDRPQPRLDADRDRGMAVTVGRLRRCPVLSWKFVVLGHNTVRGAAGAAILNAELMVARGLLNGS
ncbi:MAG: aspartate-semialdehyde dehydrogenase [Vicinamibacteraceae bacterium]|nr:aspartate-semialdehyde dehydrogenase [Vicinamibacteraceae bacterium]